VKKKSNTKSAATREASSTLVLPRLLRRPQAAAYLAISAPTFDAYRAQGLIREVPMPAARNGGQLRTPTFDIRDLDLLIDRLKEDKH
jgi:hypothetical protein